MAAANHGGLEWWWWDFTVACGCEGPDSAPAKLGNVSMAWNPRKVLRAIFGGNADAAFAVCRNWARDQEALQEAVSAACEWAILYHHGYSSYDAYVKADRKVYMRHGQSVSAKPGNYVRESLFNALYEFARDAGPDRWKRGSAGDHCTECDGKGWADGIRCDYCEGTGTIRRRKHVHAYRTELLRGFDSDDPEPGEPTTPLNDPRYRPPDYSGPGEEDPDALMREQLAALVDTYLAAEDEGKVRAFRAIYMSQDADGNSLRELAKELDVSHETVRRWATEIFGTLSRLFTA
jgi:DNA-directed RNA polymerase specialized sigma24 family protein